MDNITTQLIDELTLEDLTESQQIIANIIGLKVYADICIKIGGGTLCFPNRRNLLKCPIKRHIQQEFDGTNIRELSKKYEVSQSTVYNVLNCK